MKRSQLKWIMVILQVSLTEVLISYDYNCLVSNSSKVMVNPVFIRPDDLSIEESMKTKRAS